MSKTRTRVKIGAAEYTIVGDETEEYIHRVAIFVSRKMEELSGFGLNLTESMLSTLTALNIADELIKLRESNALLVREAETLRERLDSQKKAGVIQITQDAEKARAERPAARRKNPREEH